MDVIESETTGSIATLVNGQVIGASNIEITGVCGYRGSGAGRSRLC